MHRIAISGLVALAAVIAGAVVPAAATAQTTPATPSVGNGNAPRISCVTAADCLGIEGSSSQSTGTSDPARVARWNGSSWKGVKVTLPKGTRSADLLAVSCRGAKSCLVVGDYYTGTGNGAVSHPLDLAYNGTSVKPLPPVPLPQSGTYAALRGVSCTATGHCVAVGTASGNPAAFGVAGPAFIIETWNGSKWTLHTVTAPAGKTAGVLSAISCVTSAYCVLAGSVFPASGSPQQYLASWNGRKLTTMKPAAAGGSKTEVAIGAISCATTSSCVVTGALVPETSGPATITTFTEAWNGRKWQAATVPWPPGSKDSYLVGVSCYAARACAAVGLTDLGATAPDAVAASFNGTAWVVQPVPAHAKGRESGFSDVSCRSAKSCVAIGETGTAAKGAIMTGVWNGTSWQLDPGF